MQASLKKQTRQLRGISACMGMASARKGKANMVPPMPLTPETKPPANQQTKTKISSASGMASSFLAPAWGRAPAAVMALTGLCLRRQDKNGFLLPSRRDDVHSALPALLHGKAPIADGTPRRRPAGLPMRAKETGCPLPERRRQPLSPKRGTCCGARRVPAVRLWPRLRRPVPWHLPSPCPSHVPKGTTSASRSVPHRPFARTVLCRKDRRPTGARLPGPRTAGEVHAVR